MKNKHKNKDRRRAILCELARKSNSHPGYYKYIVDIKETDGSTAKHPAYGVDMQDALKRLLRSERNEKIVNVVSNRLDVIFILSWFTLIIAPPVIAMTTGDYRWAVYPLTLVFGISFIIAALRIFKPE
jgi:hypothetical protein